MDIHDARLWCVLAMALLFPGSAGPVALEAKNGEWGAISYRSPSQSGPAATHQPAREPARPMLTILGHDPSPVPPGREVTVRFRLVSGLLGTSGRINWSLDTQPLPGGSSITLNAAQESTGELRTPRLSAGSHSLRIAYVRKSVSKPGQIAFEVLAEDTLQLRVPYLRGFTSFVRGDGARQLLAATANQILAVTMAPGLGPERSELRVPHLPADTVALAAHRCVAHAAPHILLGTESGVVYEIGHPGPVPIARFSDPIVDLAGFESRDDGVHHAIVVTRSGPVWDTRWGEDHEALTSRLADLPGAVAIGAFFASDDNMRIVHVVTQEGALHEIFFDAGGRRGESVIASFPAGSLADVASFYSYEDRFRHAVVSRADGVLEEVLYHPCVGVRRVVLTSLGGPALVSGTAPQSGERRVAAVTADGLLHEHTFGSRTRSITSSLASFAPRSRLPCNGSPLLCERSYDVVSSLTTHNAYAHTRGGWTVAPAQTYDMRGQLDAGVRALMLDIHPRNPAGTPWLPEGTYLCHGDCAAGNYEGLGDGLALVKRFLDENPREVVTLIFESYVSEVDLEGEFAAAGLMPYLHRWSGGKEARWPTLGAMIESGRRLVVLNQAGGTKDWNIPLWNVASETSYRVDSYWNLDCGPTDRGALSHELFLLNNFAEGADADCSAGLQPTLAHLGTSTHLWRCPRAHSQFCCGELLRVRRAHCSGALDQWPGFMTSTCLPSPKHDTSSWLRSALLHYLLGQGSTVVLEFGHARLWTSA